MVRAGVCRALGAVLVASVAMAVGGCSLVLDFSEKNGDGGQTGDDAGMIDGAIFEDGGDPCGAYEPNDSQVAAAPIDPGTYAPIGICGAGDSDYFSFSLDGTQDMVVEALFTNAPGKDLEMRLYDDGGSVIDRSETFDSNERIERSLAMSNQLAAGTYAVEMFGFNNTDENTYTLVLTVVTP